PPWARDSNAVTPNATLSLKVTASDPEYAVRSMYLEYRRRDKEGRDLDIRWHRLPLYDYRQADQGVSEGVLSGMAGLPVPLAGPLLRLRPRHLELVMPWSIKGLVEEGNILLVRAAADDFDDVSPKKEPGRSNPPLELQIVNPETLKAAVHEAMRQVRDDLT